MILTQARDEFKRGGGPAWGRGRERALESCGPSHARGARLKQPHAATMNDDGQQLRVLEHKLHPLWEQFACVCVCACLSHCDIPMFNRPPKYKTVLVLGEIINNIFK